MTTKLNCFHFYWMLQTGMMMKQERRRGGDLLYVCQRRRGIRPLLRLPADGASVSALHRCCVDEGPAWFNATLHAAWLAFIRRGCGVMN